MEDFQETLTESGELQSRRKKQQKIWMWSQIKDNILDMFRASPEVKHAIPDLEKSVMKGVITPGLAADILLKEFKKSLGDESGSDRESVMSFSKKSSQDKS